METKIGIIVCGFTGDRQFITNSYIQSVRYSKGLPLVLPIVRSDRILNEYVQLCEGFLFCGGEDITPLLFGEEPLPGNGSTDVTVDLFQIRLMKQILQARKPVLAICRGMQILNVALGGTVWQDLSLAPGHSLDHMQKTASRNESSHRIRTERGSRIRQYLGPQFAVNSFHHQAVNIPGTNVHVSARAKDGTIEAVELEKYPFGIGVQWHPECMYQTSPEMRMLFREFVFNSSCKM